MRTYSAITAVAWLLVGACAIAAGPPTARPVLDNAPFPVARSCLLGRRDCDSLLIAPAGLYRISTRVCAADARLQPVRTAMLLHR